jgi:hypothetical protein
MNSYSLLNNAFNKVNGQNLTVLCLSYLQDISEYLDKRDNEFIKNRLVSQGGYGFHDGSIIPDTKTMNDKFHPEAAKRVTDCINKLDISSDT